MTIQTPINRVGFRLQVRPDLLDEYRAHHAAVWPEMLEHFGVAVGSNYSLFLDDDGTLFGYFETPGTLRDAVAAMQNEPVNERWQALMAPYFVDRRRAGRPADAGARARSSTLPERATTRGARRVSMITIERRVQRGPRPQHRAAVVGVRQLRHAVQGVRPEGRAARPVREDRRRRPGAHGSRAWRRASRCTSRGTVSTTTATSPSTRPTWASASASSTPTCSRTTTTCSGRSPTPTPGSGARPPTTCSTASTSWTHRVRATSSCGSPTAPTIPGQDDIVARQDRLAEALAEVYARLGDDQRFLLEYKLFEPAFYTMDVPDWGTAYAHCIALGPKAQVVIDTGHHAPGTNIEFIVALLLRAGSSAASTSTPASTPTTT